MGQGRENVKLYFEAHPEVLDELYDKVMDTLKNDYDENGDSDKKSSNTANKNSKNDGPKPIELEVDEDGVVIE